MPQTGTTASVGSPLVGRKTSIKFFSGDETKWLKNSGYTNSLFISNTAHPNTGEVISTFGFRDGNSGLSYISQKLYANDPDNLYSTLQFRNYSSLISNSNINDAAYVPLQRSKDGYQYVNIPNGNNLMKNFVEFSDNPVQGETSPNGIAQFYADGNKYKLGYTGNIIIPQTMGGISSALISDKYIPTNKSVASYVTTFATNNHYVTGNGLNANQIILGNGASKIRTSEKTIQTGTITTYNDNSVPTNLAVCSYVTSKLNDVLGLSTTNIGDLSEAIKQIDAIVNDGESKGTGILAYIRTNSEKIVALENKVNQLESMLQSMLQYI